MNSYSPYAFVVKIYDDRQLSNATKLKPSPCHAPNSSIHSASQQVAMMVGIQKTSATLFGTVFSRSSAITFLQFALAATTPFLSPLASRQEAAASWSSRPVWEVPLSSRLHGKTACSTPSHQRGRCPSRLQTNRPHCLGTNSWNFCKCLGFSFWRRCR